MGRIADAVLAAARREIGTVERPKNSNNVKYNTWYYKQEVYDGKNGGKYPWCMAFVQWCFSEAGFPLPHKTASCSALLNWYKKNAPELVRSEPAPGNIVIYKGHTGIFEKIGPDPKYMYVIEGNTAVGNDDNGGCVMRRYRKISSALAFITPFKEDATKEENEEMKRYDSLEEIRKISKLKNVRIGGIFSHFARADEKAGAESVAEQGRVFAEFCDELEACGI
ncbi:MAG: CHAP domain-containing protein, partial [Oscillospiraceae bacterium]|nr:CHAP domain-containing protein [Oscillospiraceae bacterium]